MSDDTQLGRAELEKMRPLTHLRGYGCLDDDGEPREDLTGNFATAACIVFEKHEVAPQELATVNEAIRQCLDVADEDDPPAQRLTDAVDQALDITTELLNKEINDDIVDWIYEWFPLIENEKCIDAFLEHMNAVVQQYALVIGFKTHS